MKITQFLSLPLLVVTLSTTLAETATTDTKSAKTNKPTADVTSEAAKAKPDWYPFHGTVSAVNTTAGTVSLHKEQGERVLHLDGKSMLSHLGKPATLGEIKVGEYAHGKLHKNSKGDEVITAAKFDKEAPPAKPKKKAVDQEKSSKEKAK